MRANSWSACLILMLSVGCGAPPTAPVAAPQPPSPPSPPAPPPIAAPVPAAPAPPDYDYPKVFEWLEPNRKAVISAPPPVPATLPPYRNPFAGDPDLGPLFEHAEPPVFRQVHRLEGHQEAIAAVALSDDGTTGLTCTADGKCWSWDLHKGEKIAEFEQTLPGKAFVAALTPDGRYGSVGTEKNGVFTWDTRTGKLAKQHLAPKNRVTAVRHTLDGKNLLIAEERLAFHRYPTTGGIGLGKQDATNPSQFRVGAWSADGLVGASGVASGREIAVFCLDPPGDAPSARHFPIPFSPADLSALAVSSDRLYCGGYDGRVHYSDIDAAQGIGRSRRGFRHAVDFPVHRLFLLGDEKVVAIASDDGKIVYWDTVGSESLETRLKVFAGEPFTISPGGLALVGGKDGSAQFYRSPDVSRHAFFKLSRKILALRDAQDYEGLEKLHRRVRHEPYLAGFLNNCLLDTYLSRQLAIHARTYGPEIEMESYLAAWREKFPDHELPRMIAAMLVDNLAWAARGSAFAPDTSREQFEQFHKGVALARRIFAPLAEQEQPPLAVIEDWIAMDMAEGRELAQSEPFLQKALQIAPAVMPVHHAMGYRLTQRWGGEPYDTEHYCRQAADSVGGDEGDILYAQLAFNLEIFASTDHKARNPQAKGFAFDFPRCLRGAKHWVAREPYNTLAINIGLKLCLDANDAKSGRYFAQWLALHNDHFEPFAWRWYKNKPEVVFRNMLQRAWQ